MTLALRYAVRSDVGLLREGNEDSAYAGPRLLAVADGMGGHAAGEVASAVAIDVLTALDGASESIYLETFIWKGDAVGRRFKASLIRKAGEGLAVYVAYDHFGNLVVPRRPA